MQNPSTKQNVLGLPPEHADLCKTCARWQFMADWKDAFSCSVSPLTLSALAEVCIYIPKVLFQVLCPQEINIVALKLDHTMIKAQWSFDLRQHTRLLLGYLKIRMAWYANQSAATGRTTYCAIRIACARLCYFRASLIFSMWVLMLEWLLLMGVDVMLKATAKGGVMCNCLRCFKDTCPGTVSLRVI